MDILETTKKELESLILEKLKEPKVLKALKRYLKEMGEDHSIGDVLVELDLPTNGEIEEGLEELL